MTARKDTGQPTKAQNASGGHKESLMAKKTTKLPTIRELAADVKSLKHDINGLQTWFAKHECKQDGHKWCGEKPWRIALEIEPELRKKKCAYRVDETCARCGKKRTRWFHVTGKGMRKIRRLMKWENSND